MSYNPSDPVRPLPNPSDLSDPSMTPSTSLRFGDDKIATHIDTMYHSHVLEHEMSAGCLAIDLQSASIPL